MDSFSKKNFQKSAPLTFLVILIICFAYYHQILFAPLFKDSFKLLCANQYPESGTFSYWLHIFTQPTHGQVQYRPLSFFTYFYILRYIFGTNIVFYNAIGLMLMAYSSYRMLRLSKQLFPTSLSCYFITLLFLIHPCHFELLQDLSCHFKYYFPLIVLIYLLESLIADNKKISLTQILLLTILSIMSHEGAISFVIIAIAGLLLKKHFQLKILLPLIFVLILFFYFRISVFGIPRSGFMAVDLSILFSSLITYLNYIFQIEMLNLGTIIYLLLLTYSIYYAFKHRNLIPLFCAISMLILLAPFSVLANHIYTSRSCWAIPLAGLLIGFLINPFINKMLPKRICLVLMLILPCFSWQKLNRLEIAASIEHLVSKLKHDILQRNPQAVIELRLKGNGPKKEEIELSILPGVLAFYFPHNIFRFTHTSPIDASKNTTVYISNGALYYSHDSKIWWDIYDYPYTFSYLPPQMTINLSLDEINKFYR